MALTLIIGELLRFLSLRGCIVSYHECDQSNHTPAPLSAAN